MSEFLVVEKVLVDLWYFHVYVCVCVYCRDYDGIVSPEELASAAMYLKDTLDKEGIQELISNLSKDAGK